MKTLLGGGGLLYPWSRTLDDVEYSEELVLPMVLPLVLPLFGTVAKNLSSRFSKIGRYSAFVSKSGIQNISNGLLVTDW